MSQLTRQLIVITLGAAHRPYQWRSFMEQNEFYKKYYTRLREMREEKGMTQTQIADILCVVQKTYSDYESGRLRFPIDSLILLAEYYDVSLDYLCGLTSERKPFPKE